MKELRKVIEKATGKSVKAVFSYNLNNGGFVDYSADGKTCSIKYEKIKKYLSQN